MTLNAILQIELFHYDLHRSLVRRRIHTCIQGMISIHASRCEITTELLLCRIINRWCSVVI